MKLLSFILLFFVLFTFSAFCMTLEQFNQCKSGDITHLKLEYFAKTYIEGDCVISFRQGDSLQVASIKPNNNFFGMFHYSFFVFSSKEQNDLQSENIRLKAKMAKLIELITALFNFAKEN